MATKVIIPIRVIMLIREVDRVMEVMETHRLTGEPGHMLEKVLLLRDHSCHSFL